MIWCSLQSSHGEDTKYYDIGDRRRSPPRYERSILERLHKACPVLLSLCPRVSYQVHLRNYSPVAALSWLQERHLQLASSS